MTSEYHRLLTLLNDLEFTVIKAPVFCGNPDCDEDHGFGPARILESIPKDGEQLIYMINAHEEIIIARLLEGTDNDEGLIAELTIEPTHPYYERLKGRWDGEMMQHFEQEAGDFFDASIDSIPKGRPVSDDDDEDNVIPLH